MFEELSTAQLLHRCRGDLVRARLAADGAPTPPDPDAVAHLERRIGRALPPSYREFLSLCDGMPATGGFVAGLRPAARVGWFRDLESGWLEAWEDAASEYGSSDPGPEVALMRRALLISESGDQALLLDPDDVDEESGEWACLTFSNWQSQPHRVGTFRAGLETVYLDFLANHDVPSVTRFEVDAIVDQAYDSMLAGDRSARESLTPILRLSWRAWLLAVQFDTFGVSPYGGVDMSTSAGILWRPFGRISVERALAEPVLLDEVVPLWVVRLVEAGMDAAFMADAEPDVVAERMRAVIADIESGSGPVADFGYSPAFAGQMQVARMQVDEDDLDAAWTTVHTALPMWRPRSRNHLAPLGLYFDKDLRRLLIPPSIPEPDLPAPSGGGLQFFVSEVDPREPRIPVTAASVRQLPARKQHSERTLAILSTSYEGGR